MSEQEKLINSFQTTNWLVGEFTEGLTHEDSIAQPPFQGNSFNWVLGHILVGRDRVLGLLAKAPVLTAAQQELYETGSQALTGDTAVALDSLIAALEKSFQQIKQGLQAATDADLTAIYDQEKQQTIAERITSQHWHETYHLGQLELLRQVNRQLPAFP